MSLDYQAIFERILKTVDDTAYRTASDHVDQAQRRVVEEIERELTVPGFDPDEVRALVLRRFEENRLDKVMMLSCLHVVACHPSVADWEEAARLVGEQEFAALEIGGPHLQRNLASVDRHRGVLAFLRGHYEVALDYFGRALERERNAMNLHNILCCLVRLGEEDEALQLLMQVRRSFPPRIVAQLDSTIESDPDLALLRTEGRP